MTAPDPAAESRREKLDNALVALAENVDASDQGPTMLAVARDILPLVDALEEGVEVATLARVTRLVEGEAEKIRKRHTGPRGIGGQTIGEIDLVLSGVHELRDALLAGLTELETNDGK